MSVNDNLRTPKFLIDSLGPFATDPCASSQGDQIGTLNNYCLERGQDGLILDWIGYTWCNPPFSQKELWAKKMMQHGNGILLLPERGSAPWFSPVALICGYYFVLGKKINFVGGPSSNNVGSVLFPFGNLAIRKIEESGLPGHFVQVSWSVDRQHARVKF